MIRRLGRRLGRRADLPPTPAPSGFPRDILAAIQAAMPAAEQEACSGRHGVRMSAAVAPWACWAVSAHLNEVLSRHPRVAQSRVVRGYFEGVEDKYHEWVEAEIAGRRWIIDGTRSQFYGADPKLLVRPWEPPEAEEEYRLAADLCYICGRVGHLDEDCSS